MKNLLTVGALLTLFAFSGTGYEVTNRTAEVKQVGGYYIYTDCVPVKEYEYIGTIDANRVQWHGGTNFSGLTYDQLRDNLIEVANKKIKKGKLGSGDAIIIRTESQNADLVKFK